MPGFQRRDDGVAQRRQVLGLHRAGRRERVQARRGRAPRRRRCCRPRRPADWSSRNDFSGAVRPAAIAPSASAVNSAESGSTPSLREARLEPVVVDQEGLAEAARVGEPDLAAVVERRSGRAGGAPRSSARPRRAAAPRRGRACSSPSTRTRLPVIRRCMTRVSGALERQQQVLAAPAQPLDRRARHRLLQLARRHRPRTSARRAPPAARSARPSSSGSSWRQTVSTSGSSGIAQFYRCRSSLYVQQAQRTTSQSAQPRWRGGGP